MYERNFQWMFYIRNFTSFVSLVPSWDFSHFLSKYRHIASSTQCHKELESTESKFQVRFETPWNFISMTISVELYLPTFVLRINFIFGRANNFIYHGSTFFSSYWYLYETFHNTEFTRPYTYSNISVLRHVSKIFLLALSLVQLSCWFFKFFT